MEKQHELDRIAIKSAQKEEINQLRQLVEQDEDKRVQMEMQTQLKLMEEKNRMLMTQVVQMRRENTGKERQAETAEKKLAAAEK